MEYRHVVYQKVGHIAWVTINRPKVMNALHPPAHTELYHIWQDFDADPEMHVAILSGTGERAFCAGEDLKYSADSYARGDDPIPLPLGGWGGFTNPRFHIWKPVIAAVNGYALGGGFELALACDIIIAAEHSEFGLPEPLVGLLAVAGGMHRISRQIPLKAAMGLLLTGQRIDAAEASRLGLVNKVVPMDELMETAERWAQKVLQCAPLAVRGTKQAVMEGLDLPLESAINKRYFWVECQMRAADRLEGMQAFVEKRSPRWTGEAGLA